MDIIIPAQYYTLIIMISKFIYLPAGTAKFTMTHVHPGRYYLYSYDDLNGDRKHKQGDYMSSQLEHIITVPPDGSIDVNTTIDLVLP
ncbi:MAG: hypothetical protein JW874_00815 [Spirochaetales bacterium]|nr:hypothetical protein [Spirochaetales bacterium]